MSVIRHPSVRGLIPARAGKTRTPAPMRAARWAHPRACGENVVMRLGPGKLAGSSPRVRGKPHGPVLSGQERGLIPARAGKTRSTRTCCRRRSAHPRACGENGSGLFTCAVGSSPRVRGKPEESPGRRANAGLIPARAGKTYDAYAVALANGAHPRACGENWYWLIEYGAPAGSSPRARGKLWGGAALIGRPRLIPARAGKTPPGRATRPARPAHPRACGENAKGAEDAAREEGSSPRVRGKLHGGTHVGVPCGLIPARAGKTLDRSSAWRRMGAHPRACGENARERSAARREKGSSPRVRGKRHPRGRHPRRDGLIPARAGKTVTATCR